MGATTCIPGAELGRLQCQHRTGARKESGQACFGTRPRKDVAGGESTLLMAQHDSIRVQTSEQMPNRKHEGGETMRSYRWQQSSGLWRNAKGVDN